MCCFSASRSRRSDRVVVSWLRCLIYSFHSSFPPHSSILLPFPENYPSSLVPSVILSGGLILLDSSSLHLDLNHPSTGAASHGLRFSGGRLCPNGIQAAHHHWDLARPRRSFFSSACWNSSRSILCSSAEQDHSTKSSIITHLITPLTTPIPAFGFVFDLVI